MNQPEELEGRFVRRHARAIVPLLALAVVALACCAGWRYETLSAVPLHPVTLLAHVVLLALGHYLAGSAVAWLLAPGKRACCEAWAWNFLLGFGAAPVLLFIADRIGARAAGWGALALLVLAGAAIELRRALRRVHEPLAAGEREPGASGPLVRALVPLALLFLLAGAAVVGMDHIVYARTSAQGVVLAPPEDNLVHAAFALEWARQQPYRDMLLAFTPEAAGIHYHYLNDVQLAAWWQLCGGDHLDLVHRERFLLQGFALLAGLYLLARSLTNSRAWALVAAALFAVLPFWFLELAPLPEKESLQRLWISFTFQGGAAFGAAFLASLWHWLQRGETRFARVALTLAGMLLLAKVYFATLAWSAAVVLVLYLRPRAFAAWLAVLALLGAALQWLQPRGADIFALQPEWAPGRFWSELLGLGRAAANDDRGLASFLEWTCVGLCVLALGALAAALASRRILPPTREGRSLALLAAASWAAFLGYASLFWFLDAHQTAFQFLPWLAIVSILVGLAALRSALALWLAERRGLRIALACAGLPLWGLVLARAYANTDGFTRAQWTSFTLTRDTWETLAFLRTSTPNDARVLSPFESPAPGAPPSPYAISGLAGRRAVNEHSGLGIFIPGYAERLAKRKREVAAFYDAPRADELRRLAAEWSLDYAILPRARALELPAELGRTVFTRGQWTVVELAKRDAAAR